MLSALRAAGVRRAAFSGPLGLPRSQLRFSYRKFSTPPPPPPKSKAGFYTGLALAVAGGVGYYFYTSPDSIPTLQAVKPKPFVPKKEDYQQV